LKKLRLTYVGYHVQYSVCLYKYDLFARLTMTNSSLVCGMDIKIILFKKALSRCKIL